MGAASWQRFAVEEDLYGERHVARVARDTAQGQRVDRLVHRMGWGNRVTMDWIRNRSQPSSKDPPEAADLVAECAATGCTRTEVILDPRESPITHLDIAREGWEVGPAGSGRWHLICPHCAKKRQVVLVSWGERGPPYARVRCANAEGELSLHRGRLWLHPRYPVREFHLSRGWVAVEANAEGVTEIRFFCPACWDATIREARQSDRG